MYTTDDAKRVLRLLGQAVADHCDELGELDGKSGDGDLGLSMKVAFEAIEASASAAETVVFSELLSACAQSCNNAAPSTMGTLISASLLGIAKFVRGREQLEAADVVAMPRVVAETIMKRGRARLGDKTILDALLPMADTAEAVFLESGSLKDAFVQAALTAQKAAEATAGMKAMIGRARWLGERAAEYPDGGAVLCALLAEALTKV